MLCDVHYYLSASGPLVNQALRSSCRSRWFGWSKTTLRGHLGVSREYGDLFKLTTLLFGFLGILLIGSEMQIYIVLPPYRYNINSQKGPI